jgi:hypothetical protein
MFNGSYKLIMTLNLLNIHKSDVKISLSSLNFGRLLFEACKLQCHKMHIAHWSLESKENHDIGQVKTSLKEGLGFQYQWSLRLKI